MAFTPLSSDLRTILRATRFQNLSVAAQNVGISQSQLSRIVKKLEGDLGFELLDRRVKRKAFWTHSAIKLAEALQKGERLLQNQIREVTSASQVTEVHLGSLEGLMGSALELAHQLLAVPTLSKVSVDIMDISELEESLLKGYFDGIFSIRTPGMKKYSLSKPLGFQAFEKFQGPIQVQSHFELAKTPVRQKKKSVAKTFLSNSLRARQLWLEKFGGTGQLPGAVYPRKTRVQGEMEVLFLANETLLPLWPDVSKFLGR